MSMNDYKPPMSVIEKMDINELAGLILTIGGVLADETRAKMRSELEYHLHTEITCEEESKFRRIHRANGLSKVRDILDDE